MHAHGRVRGTLERLQFSVVDFEPDVGAIAALAVQAAVLVVTDPGAVDAAFLEGSGGACEGAAGGEKCGQEEE